MQVDRTLDDSSSPIGTYDLMHPCGVRTSYQFQSRSYVLQEANYVFCTPMNIPQHISQAAITEAVCAATVGAALPGLTGGLYAINKDNSGGIDEYKGYIVVGFLGAMLSVIALVSYVIT